MHQVIAFVDDEGYSVRFKGRDEAVSAYYSGVELLNEMECEWDIRLIDLDSMAIVNHCDSDWFATN